MIKLKVFAGYADEVEREFNEWMTGHNYEIVTIHAAGDRRLYVLYKGQ